MPVGQQARCVASFGGEVSEGTARLETDELRFEGRFRLIIPLAEVRDAVALGGRLEVTSAAGVATFDLGPAAPGWARRILHPPTLFDKLGVKAGQRVLLVEMNDPAFRAGLDRLGAHPADGPGDISGPPGDPAGGAKGGAPDLIVLGAEDAAALQRLTALRDALDPHGALWIVFPNES
jgi:hypothetical protein